MFFSKPESTRLDLLARRRCLRDLALSKWRPLGERRITLPVPVTLKRLEMDLRVFCMAGKGRNKGTLEGLVKGKGLREALVRKIPRTPVPIEAVSRLTNQSIPLLMNHI